MKTIFLTLNSQMLKLMLRKNLQIFKAMIYQDNFLTQTLNFDNGREKSVLAFPLVTRNYLYPPNAHDCQSGNFAVRNATWKKWIVVRSFFNDITSRLISRQSFIITDTDQHPKNLVKIHREKISQSRCYSGFRMLEFSLFYFHLPGTLNLRDESRLERKSAKT